MKRPPSERAAPEPAAGVPSPCVNVCTVHPDGSHCVGCFRTLEEIAAWGTYSDAERAAVLRALERRRAARRTERRAERALRRRSV